MGCPPSVNVTAVAAGGNYTCVLVAGGTVECWGDDTFGQLGNGTISATPNPNPKAISGLTGVTQLAACPSRACALASGIQCWGEGPVGDGSSGAVGTPKGVTFARCP
jgi:alpha-tubulin suppressor-like RCC1 family protein